MERARGSATYFEEIDLTGLPSVSIENKVTEPAWDGVLRRGRRSLFPVPPSPGGIFGVKYLLSMVCRVLVPVKYS